MHFLFLLTALEKQACDSRAADSISVWNDRFNLGGESERAVDLNLHHYHIRNTRSEVLDVVYLLC